MLTFSYSSYIMLFMKLKYLNILLATDIIHTEGDLILLCPEGSQTSTSILPLLP